MGVWIGGIITYKAVEIMSNRQKYPVSILTPGINKEEIFNALKNLAPQFKQTVICGYPPFIKDIIDESNERNIDLKNLDLRIFFAAESFTEDFRDYISLHSGIANPETGTMNIYGSADIGAMAFETPTSIKARKIASKNLDFFQSLFFGTQKTPTFAQYIPEFICFESSERNILLTGNNSMPLIRYAIGDNGGVMSFDEFQKIVTST
jgi:phenylacetate-CoA ligase